MLLQTAGQTHIPTGIAGTLIHAQQVKTPPAYVIAEVQITDPVTLKKYRYCLDKVFNILHTVRIQDLKPEGELHGRRWRNRF